MPPTLRRVSVTEVVKDAGLTPAPAAAANMAVHANRKTAAHTIQQEIQQLEEHAARHPEDVKSQLRLRYLYLAQGRADQAMRAELKRLADIFRGSIIDVTDASYTIEMTGDGHKLDAFIRVLDPDLIIETVRSGPLGIARGSKRLAI